MKKLFTDEKEIKSKLINFKVTQTQKAVIEHMAAERGMKISELLMCLLEKELRQPSMTKDKKIVYEQQEILDTQGK